MTNGLGQQQFNLFNLSAAREHLPQFQSEIGIYVLSCFRGRRRLRIPGATCYVDCSSRIFREVIYLESFPFYRFR